MKINKQKKPKKTLITVLIAALILASIGGALYATSSFPFSSDSTDDKINLDTPTEEQKQQGEDTKQDTIESEQTESENSDEADIPKDENANPGSNSGGLETIITVLEADQNTLYVRSETQGIYAEGSCTLTLTKSGRTITKTAGVQALPQTTTCKGFNIPRSELSSGTYSVTLKVSAGGKNSVNKDEVSL